MRDGRFYVALEAWGTPAGFDFRLEGPEGVAEMGDDVRLAPGQRLVVEVPRVVAPVGGPPAEIRARLLRITPGRREIVAESSRTIGFTVREPGAYRVEVGIVPRQLAPWLDDRLEPRELPWIYGNPIRVLAP